MTLLRGGGRVSQLAPDLAARRLNTRTRSPSRRQMNLFPSCLISCGPGRAAGHAVGAGREARCDELGRQRAALQRPVKTAIDSWKCHVLQAISARCLWQFCHAQLVGGWKAARQAISLEPCKSVAPQPAFAIPRPDVSQPFRVARSSPASAGLFFLLMQLSIGCRLANGGRSERGRQVGRLMLPQGL